MKFLYKEAFKRNLGLLTENEQEKLKDFVIAIPGMGAMGSAHLISFVRQGFEKFKIADDDSFELVNFNRQYGAILKTIGKKKTEVMRKKALEINPNCKIEIFNKLDEDNIENFLDDVHLLVDALDFFSLDIRRDIINLSLKMKIPVVSAGPIGFGSAYLIFLPSGPNFNQYFNINKNTPYNESLAKFTVGLIPKLLQRNYMQKVDFNEKQGPSSIAGVNLASGVALINALKILLRRGEVKPVPYYHQFDVMKNKYVCKRLLFGNKGPLQKLKIKYALNKFFKDYSKN
ncbi:ThiF family adenylyltransferase [archaeon]|jgi:molybdopterin/thiamine biosynthesis adenylyltransferase|nr:ThiF family adenylyltransferase [archaeon]